MSRHCPYCFDIPARDVERHIALCKTKKSDTTLTLAEMSHAIRNIFQRMDAQDKLIQKSRGGKHAFPAECAKPLLGDDDLRVFLADGIDALVAGHQWPLFVAQKTAYVFDKEWREATQEDVRAVVVHITGALTAAFDRLVERSGWLNDDPHGRHMQTSATVYGLTSVQVKASLMKLCV
jgi:hypothetical protein